MECSCDFFLKLQGHAIFKEVCTVSAKSLYRSSDFFYKLLWNG